MLITTLTVLYGFEGGRGVGWCTTGMIPLPCDQDEFNTKCNHKSAVLCYTSLIGDPDGWAPSELNDTTLLKYCRTIKTGKPTNTL